MAEGGFIPIARIVKVHGTAGELAVMPVSGRSFDLPEQLSVWFVPPPHGPREWVVEWVRSGPKGPLVKVSGIDDRTSAEILRGRTIVCRPSDLPAEWTEEEFDPVGLSVDDVDRGFLGTIVEVIETGANDVWIVEGGPLGQVLLPVIDDVILEIDEDEGVARVRVLKGLIDEG